MCSIRCYLKLKTDPFLLDESVSCRGLEDAKTPKEHAGIPDEDHSANRDGGTRYLVTLPKRLMDQIDNNHDSKVRRGSFEISKGLRCGQRMELSE